MTELARAMNEKADEIATAARKKAMVRNKTKAAASAEEAASKWVEEMLGRQRRGILSLSRNDDAAAAKLAAYL